MRSVLRMNTRKDYESKLGKPIYSFTLYEKLKRVTITLEDNEHLSFLHHLIQKQTMKILL
jgi:hypothetical protein